MNDEPRTSPVLDPERVFAITRPHPNLLRQYLITALLSGPGFPVMAVVLYFRYHTLRYRLDDHGVSVSYGVLFRREAFLTYSRIQDIHVKRNIIERWLGLGTVEVETAGGGEGSEAIAGLTEFELVRDFLYSRMRGAGPHRSEVAPPSAESSTALLREIRDALRDAREAVKGSPK